MNSLAPIPSHGMSPSVIPALDDVVSSVPRRTTGFSTRLETSLSPEELHHSLDCLSADSAFRLARLTETEGVPPRGERTVEAEFALRATVGTAGDMQIFALIRTLASVHRWNGIRKHIAL